MWAKHCLPLILLGFFYPVTLSQAARNYSGLPPGPYCAGRYPRGQCCPGQQEDCSVPISSTTCYCDDFCHRTREDQDCCPDYWSHCRGISLPDPPEEIRLCVVPDNHYYNEGEIFKINCNMCKCSSVGIRVEVLRQENRCMIEPDLLEELQNNDLGWEATNQSKFWGRTLEEGVQLRLGTFNPPKSIYSMNPVRRIYNPDALPKSFNSSSHWPNYISGIHDQGWCGASWALTTVQVATDRYAIMSKGAEAVKLSAQHLLSCDTLKQQGCKGGHPNNAWFYLRKFGLVDEVCYPWTGKTGRCKLQNKNTLSTENCKNPPNPFRTEFYKVGPAYRLGNETDIMQEILTSGPVQAIMKVYQDFFAYKSGIYQHAKITEAFLTGYHSVRIVGWGEDQLSNGLSKKYWLVANSWGTDWGENGFFRIQKGTNECEIENYVLAAWANPTRTYN